MASPMKDGLARPAITRLATNIARAHPDFDESAFIRQACRGLSPLELKERVSHVTKALAARLPSDYLEARNILVAARDGWDRGDDDDPLRGFAAWPVFQFIQDEGLEHFEPSMSALRHLTPLFSAEFAVRPYLARYGARAFRTLESWTEDPDEHVRRLASEGCRPRLPWASRIPGLVEDPSPILPILERLRDDPALYVRKSVANNLNDIAKDHPERVLELCTRWQNAAPAPRRWIIERATRTLVKSGHPGVWGLLGFTKSPKVKVTDLRIRPKRLRIGESLKFDVRLESSAKRDQRLVVDFRVHFMKANGKTRPKVFKLRNVDLAAGDTCALEGRVSFAPISTRTYYPGEHAIEIMVNGQARARGEFRVLAQRMD